jgi:hypothetical protein
MTAKAVKSWTFGTLVPGLVMTCVLCAAAVAQGGGGGHHGGGGGAPEIDPGLAASGLALLAGGTLLLTGRKRPKTA